MHDANNAAARCAFLAVAMVSLGGTQCTTYGQRAHRDPRLVEKIESLGGEVYYDYQVSPPGTPGPERMRRKLSEPPNPQLVAQLGVDRVHRVEGAYLLDANRESLGAVAQIPHVTELFVFNGPRVGAASPPKGYVFLHDEDLSLLAQMPQLVDLTIGCDEVTAKGLVHLQRLTRLKMLRLHHMDLSSSKPLPLGHLKELTHLSITYANVGDEGVSFIAELAENLKSATFAGNRITDDGLEQFKPLRNLEQLDLPAGITCQGLKHLTSMPSLENLTLRGKYIDDECMPLVVDMMLRRLELHETTVTNEGLRKLAESNTLERLFIRRSRVTDDGIGVLAEIPSLQEVDIDVGHVALKRLGLKRPDLEGVDKPIGYAVWWPVAVDDIDLSGAELDALKKAGDERPIGWLAKRGKRQPIRPSHIQVTGEVLEQLRSMQ